MTAPFFYRLNFISTTRTQRNGYCNIFNITIVGEIKLGNELKMIFIKQWYFQRLKAFLFLTLALHEYIRYSS